MKKIISLCLAALIIVICASCEIKPASPLDEKPVLTTDAPTLSAQIGIEMKIPENARSVECYVINDLIGEINFTYDSVIYSYRASKIYSGVTLFGKSGKTNESDSIEIGDVKASVFTVENAGIVVLWSNKGTNYSLYSKKEVSVNILSEIVNQL